MEKNHTTTVEEFIDTTVNETLLAIYLPVCDETKAQLTEQLKQIPEEN